MCNEIVDWTGWTMRWSFFFLRVPTMKVMVVDGEKSMDLWHKQFVH